MYCIKCMPYIIPCICMMLFNATTGLYMYV